MGVLINKPSGNVNIYQDLKISMHISKSRKRSLRSKIVNPINRYGTLQ
jgi:hypothetical protein